MPYFTNCAIMAYIRDRHTDCNNSCENDKYVKHNKKGGCYVTYDYKKELQTAHTVGFLQ